MGTRRRRRGGLADAVDAVGVPQKRVLQNNDAALSQFAG